MRFRPAVARLSREESGLTLIELLVTIGAAIVVVGALYGIQRVALFESGRVFARVDATQEARIVMTNIESLLHSSCVADGVTPVQPGSTGTSLAFISKYGGAATLIPEKHVISLSGDQLTDATYPRSGGTAPNWTFSSTPNGTRTLVGGAEQSGSTPVFRYYAYGVARDGSGNPYLDTAGNPYVMLLDGSSSLPTGVTTSSGGTVAPGTVPANSPTPLVTPLSEADARVASAVRVALVVNPSGKLGENARYSEETTFTDTMVLRLTPPPSDRNPQAVSPCV